MRWTAGVAATLALTTCACGTGVGRPVTPQRQQVDYGGAVYRYECASCHTPGQLAPDLTAAYLASRAATAADLVTLIERTMPLDQPGVLDAGDSRALTAYLLARHGLLSNRSGELTAANEATISVIGADSG
jgi:mono/diheme cytochrome c family protein